VVEGNRWDRGDGNARLVPRFRNAGPPDSFAVRVRPCRGASLASLSVPKAPLVPPEPLSDGVIVLRLREERDAPAIADASSDPETKRWLDDEPLTGLRPRELVSRAEEQWRTGRGAPFVVADAASDRALGLLNVQFGEDEEVAGLAVSVFPEARGRGVASRALRIAAKWATLELGVRRVYAEAASENIASIRAIEKAGFHREGVLRAHCKTHGRTHDCVMFSVLPGDFASL
jgi:RimJ/RimL family protein N-acetyltransferase